MGITVVKVGLLVGVLILPLYVEANVCQFGKQYWSSLTGTCVECTECNIKNQEVVIRPCQVHADTLCGPISALKLEWPTHNSHGHHKHHKEEENKKHQKNGRAPHSHHHHHHHLAHDLDLHDLPIHKLEKDPLINVKEWERLLKQSREQLHHRKENLMKSLLEKKIEDERKNQVKHNDRSDEDSEEDLLKNHQSREYFNHRPHISALDLEILERLENTEHRNRNSGEKERFNFLNERLRKVEHRSKIDSSDQDLPDLYNIMAIVPSSHRLILGESSRVPETMVNQNIPYLAEEAVSSERIPFTAAERFVWDWQAVALISAICACLLFFILLAVYSILHARQWRHLKENYSADVEDLALRASLMQHGGMNNGSAETNNANHYLEKLVAEKKLVENKSNIYIEKQPS